MNQSTYFSRFRIDGLRGSKTIDTKIKDNTLIMVGENGSGKTTFLRILFYFLSGRWPNLSQFNFEKLTAVINDHEYTIKHEDIEGVVTPIDERILRNLPVSARRRVVETVELGKIEEARAQLYNFARRYGVPFYKEEENVISKTKKSQILFDLNEEMVKSLNSQILYLPTYRRIERELSSIVQGTDPDDMRRFPVYPRQSEDGNDYVELVEFGMNDVKKAIDTTLEEIRNFQLFGTTRLSLGYLGDVVNQSYLSTDKKSIVNASEETINNVLNRVDNTILSEYNNIHLRNIILNAKNTSNTPSEHEMIIYHYFTKLINFQAELSDKESNIKAFCNLCSEYIIDKKFVYKSDEFSFQIASDEHSKDISLSDLSSGEKQIVSLFSHLYLSGRDKFFVLIDEPELSLSVPWQRRFLIDIRKASFSSGMIAVTHSPFIYDNELKRNTHALGEFILGPDWGNIR